MTPGTLAPNAIASNAAAAATARAAVATTTADPHLVPLPYEDCLIQARLVFGSSLFTAPRCKHAPTAESTVKAK